MTQEPLRRSRSRSRERYDGRSLGGNGMMGGPTNPTNQMNQMSAYAPNTMSGGAANLPFVNPILLTAQQAAQDKINRELFVGNTPPGTSEMLLLQFLNGALRRVKLCEIHETPILNCRVNSKFAFIELVNSDTANRALNLNGIPFLGAVLKVSRPSKYSGPMVTSRSWQELTGQQLPTGVALDAEQEKVNRELFIGNTTPEMTEQMLKDFLGNALEQVGLSVLPGNPISACRVSGKFAFIELRSPQEAANALNLNNIPFLGTQLRVGRPSKWNGPTSPHGNWEDILAKYMSGELQLPNKDGGGNTQNQQNNGAQQPHFPPRITNPPSRVVELKNMLTKEDLENDEEYNDILEDTTEECSQFGQLVNVVIPKGNEVGATKIFLEYTSESDAAKAIGGLEGRTFDGRKVEADYFDETKFTKKDYA